MNHYQSEVLRLRRICYSNTAHLETVIGTRKYIDQHYASDINLDLLAFVRYTSKYHLLRLFKRYYGITPRQYLIQKRIEIAKKLLAEGMSVTECCFEVGFDSPGSFSSLFKRRVGCPPSEYKKAQFSRSI